MKFRNIPDYLGYKDLNIKFSEGCHTICNVQFIISEDAAESFLSAAEKREQIEVLTDSGDLLMTGIIQSVDVEYRMTSTRADVIVTSPSIIMAENSHKRIFQDPNKTVSDILKNYTEVKIGACENLSKKIDEIICQDNIDDYSFLLLLSEKCGCGVWSNEEGQIIFGKISGRRVVSDSDKDVPYTKEILEKKILAEKNGRTIEVLTMEQMPVGSEFVFNNIVYTICSVEIFEEFGEAYFKYVGKTNPAYLREQLFVTDVFSNASIVANSDPECKGRVQVAFQDYEEMSDEKKWIPYLTPFSGRSNDGVVMIPDLNDQVLVALINNNVCAIGSLREKPLSEKCRNLEKKYISVGNSIITIEDDSISACLGGNAEIVIKDNHIAERTNDTYVTMEEESLQINAGNVSLQLDSSIKGIVKNGTIELSANNIEMKT